MNWLLILFLDWELNYIFEMNEIWFVSCFYKFWAKAELKSRIINDVINVFLPHPPLLGSYLEHSGAKLFYLVVLDKWETLNKCDHIKLLITLTSDNIKRLSLCDQIQSNSVTTIMVTANFRLHWSKLISSFKIFWLQLITILTGNM